MQRRMLLGCVFAFLYLSTLFAQNTDCNHEHHKADIGDQIFESLNEEMAEMLSSMARNIEENKCNDNFVLPSTCFAPDTDASEVEKFYKAFHDLKVSLGIDGLDKYNNTGRWTSTAKSGGGLAQGDSTTLTWSYVPDGTEIANNCSGDPGDVSDFVAFFNGIYGGPTTPGDLSTAPWHQKFVDMFEDWSSKTGLTFVYESNDDGVPYASNVGANPGVTGTRGDIRIGGARIDGNSGILACNYFPNVGDMIIDTDDNFYSNNSGLGVDNILAHEVGHGIGIRHVCPTDQTKLMEPFISTAFDGPQEDDFLASNRHYGDNFEGDDALADALDLGAIDAGVVLSECHSIDDDGDADFYSFSSNADAAAFNVAMLPTGTTYLEGAQNGDGSCQAGTNFNAQAISDLQLNYWQGGMINSTSDVNGPGVSENLAFKRSDPTALEEFSVDQQVVNDDVQIYDFQVVVSASVTDKFVGACDPATNEYELDFDANWANETGVTADISLTVGGVVQPGFPRTLPAGFTYSELISLSLPADGSNDDIVLTNSAYAITLTESNTAPVACSVSCANEGDIVITEIMQNPSAVSDSDGEYFEVYNTTGSDIDLDGWEISDDGTNSHTIGSSVIVPAGGYAVLARNENTATNGGVAADYEYGNDIALANGADEVILTCSGTEIDRVNYDGGPNFPDPTGASMNLDPNNLNATDNDDGANWCESTSSFGDGDLGTPGAANDACGTAINPGDVIITEIMQNPSAVSDSDGEYFEVYNTTAADIDMNGWTIKDDGSDSHIIGSSLVVSAGGYAVLARNGDTGTNGGFNADYVYGTDITLANGADEVILELSSTEIDRVNYDGGPNFPDPTGASMNLDPNNLNATDNDDGANWCESTSSYGDGDLGTPGAANDACVLPCNISAITTSNISACDPQTDTYTADVMVTFENAPATGNLDLTGDGSASVAVGALDGPTSHTFSDVEMPADGGPIELTATFSDETSCTFTENNAGAAPMSCAPGTSFDVSVSDPCSCNNDATLDMSDGTFAETVTVSTNPPTTGLTILVGDGSTGLIGVSIGDPFTDNGDGTYEISFDHADGVGYTMNVAQDMTDNIIGSISNTCYYPVPSIDNLDNDYCENDPVVNLMGSAQLGDLSGSATAEAESWSGPGVTGSDFDPSAAGPGMHTIIYEFDAQDDDPDAQHPGCISSVSQDVEVLDAPEMGITSFSGNPTTPLCAGEQGIYLAAQNNVNNDVASYDWTFSSNNSTPVTEPGAGAPGTGQLADDGTPRRIGATWSAPGMETVTLVVTFLNGCSSTTVLNVMINANPDPPLVDDVEVCDGEDTTIEPQAGGGGGGMMTALQEDFEDDVVEYTTSQAECSDGFEDYFIRTDGSDLGSAIDYQTPVGSSYFAVMDTDGAPCVESPTSMFFSDIDITGLTNVEFCVYLAEDDDGSNEDWDITDYVHFDYDIDNSGTFSPMIWVESEPDGDDFNAVPKIDTDFDGDGDGAEITPTFTQYCFSIPGTGTELDIEIEFALNSGDEDIAIDEVTVTGDAAGVDCTFNYYDVDPDANPGSTPIAMGDTYDPMTTVANSPETYWVTCVDDMTGCESEATEVTVTVNANPEMGITSFSGNPTTPLCAGEQGIYLAAQSNANNDVASYDWTFSSNNSTPVTEPGAGGPGTGQLAADGTPRRIGATWSAPGMETVTLVVTFLNGCSSTTVLNVMVNATPDAPIVEDVEVCDGEDTTIEPQAAGGGGGMMTALQEDFEDDIVEYTTSQAECSDGFGDFFIRTDGSDIGTFVEYFTPVGSNYFAVMDTDGSPCVESPTSMLFSDIDITGLTNIEFCVYLAEDDDGSNEDWDISDFVHFDYDIDNSGTFSPMIWVESEPDGDDFNAVPKIDTDFDGDGDGAEITPTFTQYCFSIPGTGTELDIEIEFALNAGDEDIAIDEVTVTGEASAVDCTFNYYDVDPDANPGSTPIAMGDTYDPMTTVGNSPETYWVTCVDDMNGCESEATEVTVTVNANPEAPTVDDVVVCEDEKAVIEPEPGAGSAAPMLIASDDFDSPVGLNARSNTTDQGTQPDHEDQFTIPGDLFGITDGQSGTPMPRQAPFAIVDDAADAACNGFFPFDDQGVLPCNYGNNYFGVVDTENGENMGTVSADWTFDVSAATAGVSLICIDMGAMGDFESSDDHTWSVDVDGGGFNQIFMLEADEAATATYDITNGPETLNDPMTLNGQQILNGLTTFCAEVNCEIGNELTLRLETTTNGGSEAVAYDNIEIYGSSDPTQVVFKFYDQDPSAGGIDPVHCGPDYCPPTTLATSPETYWVTAESCEGCESEATEVQVTINPIPTVDPTDDMVHCDGDNVPGYMFTGAPAGTEFDWTASEDVGFGTSGMGDIPPYTATTNGEVVPVVSEVIVTPSFTNLGLTCVGEPDTFLVTVNPTPDVDQVDDIEACDGDVVPAIMLTGSVPGTVFNWTNDNTSIGLGASGMGDIPSFTAVNPGPTIQVANIEVTPTFTNAGVTCTGDVMTFTITVFPRPIIEFERDSVSICKFDSLDLSLFGAEIIENGSGASDGSWSTSGDGTFVPDPVWSTALSYEPGPMDIDNGEVTITLTTDDPAGPCGPESMEFKVVLEDPPPMSCTDFQASLGNDGTYLVTAADALTTIPVDWTSYSVVIEDANGDPIFGSPVLNCSHIGQELYVKVTENCGGNSCWSRVFVEDKIEPVLSCPAPASFSCIEDSAPGQVQTRRFETTPNVAIGPDAGDVTNIVQTVPNYGNVAIQGVNVYIDFNFDNIVDFFNAGGVTLTSPEGTTYDMYPIFINPNCQLLFGVDGADHGFDDSSPLALAFCQDINSGNDLVPIGASLDASFAGEDPEGQWTWAFTDAFDAQGGTVNRLVIELELVNTLEMPIVQENCDYELTYEDITDNRNACGIGTVIREWKATDESGNTGTCTQTLIFENIDPPAINPPADYEADCFVDPISLTPDVTGEVSVVGNDDCAQYAIGYDDLFLDDCAPYGYKIRRSWTVLDWCDEDFLFEHDQIIKIVDEEAPVISCPADFTVSLRHNDCETNVSLPTATAIDNCDFDVDIDRELLDPNGVVIGTSNVPVGRYSARYIATDACGNTDTCYVWVQVIDPVAPVVVTNRNLVVSLTAGGWAYLCADQVDDGSNDNCTDVGIYIKKEGDDNGEYWRNFDRNDNCVRFQCRDLGENQVKLRVYDDADGDGFFGPQEDTNNDGSIDENDRNGDNYNEAWATVLVEDKLPPILVCPPDISVNCEADFNDLDITGEAEADLNCDREDPTYTDRLPDGNCPGSDIVRTWRVEKRLPGYDGVEGTADDLVWVRSCEQLITITDDTPVTIEKLPLDITIDCAGGAVGTDPDDLRKYNFFDDYLNTPQNPGDDSLVVYDNPVIDYDCEDLGINYEDQQFGLCMPGSYKIRRNWTIIDWCDDEYEVAYTQVIFVDDKEAPELTVNNPGTVLIDNNDTQCGTFADITASAFDLCSNVSITNNSPYGPGTHDASGTYPQGTYSITFTAVDGCGNVATEEITVNVVDGKAPTAVCKYGIAGGLKQNCDLILSADYFDAGSTDNCTDQSNLSFEVARVDSLGNYIDRAETILFDCFDATNDNDGNVRVALFVIDEAGNEAVCETVIDVQAGECPLCDDIADPPSLNVTGTVIKENGDLVNGVEILVDGQSQGMINGNYGMLIDKDRRTGMAYASIEALKADVVDNGVSTRDLVKIRRDILRIEQLNRYQDVAADVNNDERVSTLDMVEIRQAILKQIDEFSKVPSWRFVPAAHQFGAHTWETPVPFVYELASSEQELHVDFIALKMGDVTGDADVNSSRSTGTFNVKVAEAELQAADQGSVSIYTEELQDITGYQFTLQFDPSKAELLNITGDVEDYNFNLDMVDSGLIAVSKVTNDTEGNELFQLNFEVLQTTLVSDLLRINSEITRAEAYNRSSDLLDIELTVEGSEASYALYQNVPNPFDNLTRIGFHMAKAGEATLVIMDNQGKVLTERKGYYQAGYNSETFNRAQLPASGLYYYQLRADDFTATKKMLVVN